MPDMPIAGKEVADEINKVCDEKSCYHLILWFNHLYKFRLQYKEYQEELSGVPMDKTKIRSKRICMPWDDCR